MLGFSLSKSAVMGARSWEGVAFSLFPVQTLGERDLDEVRSFLVPTVKLAAKGGGVSLTSLVHIMASWRCIYILALKMKETKLSKNAQHKQLNCSYKLHLQKLILFIWM